MSLLRSRQARLRVLCRHNWYITNNLLQHRPVYVKSEVAYATTHKCLQSNIQSGYSLPLQALLNSLKEQKFIIPDSDGRPKSRLCLSGNRMRVIKLDKKKYFANV